MTIPDNCPQLNTVRRTQYDRILHQHCGLFCHRRQNFRSKELKVDNGRSSVSKSAGVYRCPHCPYTNTNPKLVHGHKVMHSIPQLKCSYCGHLDHYPSRMMRHMRRRHRGMSAKYVKLGAAQTDVSSSSSQAADDDADGKRITHVKIVICWIRN